MVAPQITRRPPRLSARREPSQLCSPDAVDDDVGPSAAGKLPDFSGNVRCPVIERGIGAELPGHVELGVGSAGHDGPGSQQPGDLKRGQSHTAANTPNQDRLPGPGTCPGGQHAPRGQSSE